MMMASTVDLGGLLTFDCNNLAVRIFCYCTIADLCNVDIAMMSSNLLQSPLHDIYRLLTVNHLPRGLDRNQMAWLFKRSIKLKSVSFDPEVSMTDMAHILRQLHKGGNRSLVKYVDMSSCGDRTTDALFSQLFNVCTQMEILKLNGCKKISKDNIHQLSILCTTLTSLDLTDCDLVKTVGALAKGFPSLTELNIRRSSPCGKQGNNTVKDSTVRALCQGCPALLSLDLSCCDNTRDAALISLSKSFPALTALNMGGCDKITDTAVRTISQSCRGLSSVELGLGHDYSGKVTDSSVIALAHNCPSLTSFGIGRCYNITDAAAIVLGRGCPNLTHLDFTCCKRVTNEGVIALSQGCPSLTSLCLSKCVKVTGVAVTALSQGCPLLTTLSLRACEKISDSSVVALSEGCKHLTTLDISYCTKVTDEAIIALATNCPKLDSFLLTGCDEVTDEAVIALMQRYPGLRSLKIHTRN
eukprot:CAMPEP_0114413652 /NCGR_PEP_ID=MMETSP0103-20121206/968_1 /TAXON_ID=37642 ORGANISM="Paraphysomonas imperforata, Strain PA2" /NCGR_SAMPLE_ID=MMETSP0103 /ASSEMBLY_ACC=CAM_ASM_000201 /LENGTH=469 /DNA_ID=CAMNT_0001581739 /DNA_START=134 /DNA_END=1543 /DNA_ORIENTATION=-